MEEKLYSIDDIIRERIQKLVDGLDDQHKDDLSPYLNPFAEYSMNDITMVSKKLGVRPSDIVCDAGFEIVSQNKNVRIHDDLFREAMLSKQSEEECWRALLIESHYRKTKFKRTDEKYPS